MDNCLIDKCKEEFKTKFIDPPSKNSNLSSESLNTEEMGALDEFARFFFIQMSNALFCGEYLQTDYIEKIKNFIQLLSQSSNITDYVLYARKCLKDLEQLVLSIDDKTKIDSKNFFGSIDLENEQNKRTSVTEYFFYWEYYSLNLAVIDHNLINDSNFRDILTNILCDLKAKKKGLDGGELEEVFDKLISKDSFLLSKIIVYGGDQRKYFLEDLKEKSLDDILSIDHYNESFVSLFKEMYPCNIDSLKIQAYQNKCYDKQYTCLGFIILAHYYGTNNKKRVSVEQLDNLLIQFEDFWSKYKLNNGFNSYALRTVKNYIYNCRYSLLLKQSNITMMEVKQELKKIEHIQNTTGIKNYHPYKKTLGFIDKYFKNNKNQISQLDLDFYDDVYKKYQFESESCFETRFSPFCLPIDESSEEGIFFASSVARPISRRKWEDATLNFRILKQYLSYRLSLSKKEKEIAEKVESLNSFRKESFEILGIFIAIITFLFGGLQLFAQKKMTLQELLTNIFSLGIVIVMFMSLIYIVLSCSKKKIGFLVGALILCFGVLICVNKFGLLICKK